MKKGPDLIPLFFRFFGQPQNWKTKKKKKKPPNPSQRLSLQTSNCNLIYFALRLARFAGGFPPFSGTSCSILSDNLCNALSPFEESPAPSVGTLNPCAVYVASLNVDPDFAAATSNTPCGTPLLKTVAM